MPLWQSSAAQAHNSFTAPYLGGSGGTVGFPETGAGIAVDAAGNAYVTGTTSSVNFPAVNAHQSSLAGGGLDAFVAKVNPLGNGLVYSTYLGGSSADYGLSIAVDSAGEVAVAGYTASPDFPTLLATQAIQAASYDAFVTRLSSGGAVILGSTFLGGNASDSANAVATDTANNLYLAGQTLSTNFSLRSAFQPTPGGGIDGFFTRFSPLPSGPPDVHIDSPVAGATVSGTIAISGWAINSTSGLGAAIGSVTVTVDGTISGSATYGVSRPDLCVAFPIRAGCPSVGFSYQLDTSMLSPGSHTITVSAASLDNPKPDRCSQFHGNRGEHATSDTHRHSGKRFDSLRNNHDCRLGNRQHLYSWYRHQQCNGAC
jgi:hypothetical protein